MYRIYTVPMQVSYPSLLRDKPRQGDNSVIMERYFNDIYTVFLNRLTTYTLQQADDNPIEANRLRAMLEEIIKVHEILNKEEIQKNVTIE